MLLNIVLNMLKDLSSIKRRSASQPGDDLIDDVEMCVHRATCKMEKVWMVRYECGLWEFLNTLYNSHATVDVLLRRDERLVIVPKREELSEKKEMSERRHPPWQRCNCHSS